MWPITPSPDPSHRATPGPRSCSSCYVEKPEGATGARGPGWRARASVLLRLAGGMSCSCDCESRCCWCETETVRYPCCPTMSSLGEGKECLGGYAPLGEHISAVPSRRLEWESAKPWASGAGSRKCDCVMGGVTGGVDRQWWRTDADHSVSESMNGHRGSRSCVCSGASMNRRL